MNRPTLQRPIFQLALALGLVLVLSACGNRGALVLPEEAPPPMPAKAEPAAAAERG